jgi:ribonuclease BN (tRNA processing enzyme)
MKRRFDLEYIELEDGAEREILGLAILPGRVTHMRKGIPFGYRIGWQGRALGLSGDTEWDENLIALAEETDIFLMECYTADKKIPFHTSLKDLEREGGRLRTRRLLLTHMGEDVRRLAAPSESPFEAARDGQRIEF